MASFEYAKLDGGFDFKSSSSAFGGLCAGTGQEWRAAFTDFWRLYREYDANHPVFQEQHDMSVRLPVFCHGDEGRGLRRVPFMVEVWQPVLSHKGANCTNMSGHTFCSRLLFTCISSKLFAGDLTLRQINRAWAEQMISLSQDGVPAGIWNLFLTFLGGKGDWPYLRKALDIYTGSGYCCRQIPAENWHDFSEDAPWRHERPNPSPFKEDGNPFHKVPGADDALRVLPDVMHTYHIGFGVDFCASIIMWLANLGHFGHKGKIDDWLREAHSRFMQWCAANGKYSACTEWSRRTFHMKSKLVPNSGAACKAHDTGVVTAWLEHVLRGIAPDNGIIDTMRYTVSQCNVFFRTLHKHGNFIPPADKDKAMSDMQT
ncbi:unnamed protein product [Effrenium voratum]|uniref:Uncharacterized protein n=1 Tax=Effrenium voratum TaxID=2562239 RepID=A0AA36HX55_9DINO|nr:unnamed protein product [Effrenium voratum]